MLAKEVEVEEPDAHHNLLTKLTNWGLGHTTISLAYYYGTNPLPRCYRLQIPLTRWELCVIMLALYKILKHTYK